MAWCKVGDKVENIFAAEEGEEDRFRCGVVIDVFFDRQGTEMVEVEHPGYHYVEIEDEYLRLDTRS